MKMKRILLFVAIVSLFAMMSAYSAGWHLERSVWDEFSDETEMNRVDRYIYGEDNKQYSDKYICFYIEEFEFGYSHDYSFANGYIAFGGEGRMDIADNKPCTVSIKDDDGEIIKVRTRCSIESAGGLLWSCIVKLNSSDVETLVDVFAFNKAPELVVNIQGKAPYKWGTVDCNGVSFDPTCLEKGHIYFDGECAICGIDDPLIFSMIAVDWMPEHGVDRSFSIGETEVTQALYEYVMGENPSYFNGALKPVETVSWYDAVLFCNILSDIMGLEMCYSLNGDDIVCDFSKNGYRLPTEAEWRYAAKGGNKSMEYEYSGSDHIGEVAWYYDNSGEETHSVGSKKPNELGIYDMSGNVWEWCWDASGTERVDCGGSWYGEAEHCSISYQDSYDPSDALDDIGFRIARSILK